MSDVETRAWLKTGCILWSINCGLEVQVGGADGRHIELVRGDRAHPASQGYSWPVFFLVLPAFQNRHRPGGLCHAGPYFGNTGSGALAPSGSGVRATFMIIASTV